jgi:hypothetical protein
MIGLQVDFELDAIRDPRAAALNLPVSRLDRRRVVEGA